MPVAAAKTPETSDQILARFKRGGAGGIDLTLRPAYMALLAKLGNPHLHLPPVFHVAGTNGKGSVCAFLRAILEAAGFKVHVYTSPHLVTFYERIRVAGELIAEDDLASILTECESLSEPGAITHFEASTAAAFTAFARHPAAFTILETGLGGRLDATNVVPKPLATLITRISYDHREFLGTTLQKIASEKAGIMRDGIPCFSVLQPAAEAAETLRLAAAAIHAPLSVSGKDWSIAIGTDGFSFDDKTCHFDLPKPALIGAHQYENAGLAIASLSVLPEVLPQDILVRGLQTVAWPARLQKLERGVLADRMPEGWDLWLDGGHNDSAGEVLARQAETWKKADGKPLYLICGMLSTKRPDEFLAPLKLSIDALRAVAIPHEMASFSADDLAKAAQDIGIKNGAASDTLSAALSDLTQNFPKGRILICGSLYLAGDVLRENGV